MRTWVTFTDIILGGGYVDPQARFPPDTEMELTLDLNVIRVHTRAVVRVTYPFLGMGLASTEMAPDERSRLEQMLGALGGTVTPPAALRAMPRSDEAVKRKMPFVVDAMLALKELVRHFENKDQLTRQGFVELVENSQNYSKFRDETRQLSTEPREAVRHAVIRPGA